MTSSSKEMYSFVWKKNRDSRGGRKLMWDFRKYHGYKNNWTEIAHVFCEDGIWWGVINNGDTVDYCETMRQAKEEIMEKVYSILETRNKPKQNYTREEQNEIIENARITVAIQSAKYGF